MQTLLHVSCIPLCAIACINVCVHVKDPVVQIKSLVDYGNGETPGMHCRLGSVTVAAGFPLGEQPDFPMGKIPNGTLQLFKTTTKKEVKS